MQELLAQRQTQSVELSRLMGLRDDAQAELKRLESDVAVVTARAERDAALLAKTSNVKEAQGLEHEIASLAKRRSDLEDAELELMERLEAADAEVAAQQALVATTNDEGARLSAEGKAAVAEATARLETATRDRAAVAAELPADLVAMYDRLGPALQRRACCAGARAKAATWCSPAPTCRRCARRGTTTS